MSQTLMLTQALLALMGLFVGTWILLNPIAQKHTAQSILAAALTFSVGAYLLCQIEASQTVDPARLLIFEQASTGLTIATLGLLPWILASSISKPPSPYLVIHGAAAILLGIANYRSPLSIRFETSHNSPWLASYYILSLATAAFCIRRASKPNSAGQPKLPTLLVFTAITIALGTLLDAMQSSSSNPTDDAFEEPLEQHALLLQLSERDAILASKLLASKGYIVMREDDTSEIPASYFQEKNVHYSIFFDRDNSPHIPRCLKDVPQKAQCQLSLFAISSTPRSPRIQREIRKKHYKAAIRSPLKAMELFQAIDSQCSNSFRSTQSHHTRLS